MSPTPSDRSDPAQELSVLITNITHWRLRLRNVDPKNNQALEPQDPDFLPPHTESWFNAEATFYDRFQQIQILLLNQNNVKTLVKTLPLESLFPLAALLRIVLDNRHPATNTALDESSPYYQTPKAKTWTQLDRCWHKLRDRVGILLKPQINKWIGAPWIKSQAESTCKVKLQPEHLDEATSKLWEYLSLSLTSQFTTKGRDCVFNPHYQQSNGQPSTVKAWLDKRLFGAVMTVAKQLAGSQAKIEITHTDPDTGAEISPLDNIADEGYFQTWWEIIRNAVTEEFAEELQQIKPRSKNMEHINAQVVILNRLPPPQDWTMLAQGWGCNRTTLERFYKTYCIPWLQEHFAELEDYL